MNKRQVIDKKEIKKYCCPGETASYRSLVSDIGNKYAPIIKQCKICNTIYIRKSYTTEYEMRTEYEYEKMNDELIVELINNLINGIYNDNAIIKLLEILSSNINKLYGSKDTLIIAICNNIVDILLNDKSKNRKQFIISLKNQVKARNNRDNIKELNIDDDYNEDEIYRVYLNN